MNDKELLRISAQEHLLEGELEGTFNFARDRLPSPLELRLKVEPG